MPDTPERNASRLPATDPACISAVDDEQVLSIDLTHLNDSTVLAARQEASNG
ncbi:hypothetical protein [Gryllotalpicola sp.]|uniref:hypothetical protein n=1 Tax=Gryllotalpicola sp. TaxID=1932787 RepID=UPI002627BE6C|nr:hypothetical protein [Gryllotalpicola sp.]